MLVHTVGLFLSIFSIYLRKFRKGPSSDSAVLVVVAVLLICNVLQTEVDNGLTDLQALFFLCQNVFGDYIVYKKEQSLPQTVLLLIRLFINLEFPKGFVFYSEAKTLRANTAICLFRAYCSNLL